MLFFNLRKNIAYFVIFFTLVFSIQAHAFERPQMVKDAIDSAFNALAGVDGDVRNDKTPDEHLLPNGEINRGWYYNGAKNYNLMKLDDEKLILSIVKNAHSEQKEFNIMDLGAGDFAWGRHMAEIVNSSQELPDDIHFTFVSLRGEKNPRPAVTNDRKCKIIEIGDAKIEELEEVLKSSILEPNMKFDLIVSRWTLHHLVDASGTFIQAYNAMNLNGLFIFDGFFMSDEKYDWVARKCDFNDLMLHFLISLDIPFLMDRYNESGSLNHFIVKKTDERKRELPWAYAGDLEYIGDKFDVLNTRNKYLARYKIPASFLSAGHSYGAAQKKVEATLLSKKCNLEFASQYFIYGDKNLFDELDERELYRNFLTRTHTFDERTGTYLEGNLYFWCPYPVAM